MHNLFVHGSQAGGDDNSTTKWNEKLTGPAAQQTYQKKYDMILFVAAAKQIYYLCEIL
jgi:hypothetical protein